MREAWRELMIADEDGEAKLTRDPVAPARSDAAMKTILSRTLSQNVEPELPMFPLGKLGFLEELHAKHPLTR